MMKIKKMNNKFVSNNIYIYYEKNNNTNNNNMSYKYHINIRF